MRKAIFVDRDGVVNSDEGHYYIYKVEDFVLNPDLPEALATLKEAGYLLILISNQGGVAKNIYTTSDVEAVHTHMQSQLKIHNAQFDDLFYCPHHNDIKDCDCRKPKPGMILEAAEKHQIDLGASYFIGDSPRDIVAGEAAGLKASYLVEKNKSILKLCKNIVNL